MLISLFKILVSAFKGFNRNEGPMMAGHLAFLALLSSFPFVIFFAAVAGMIGDSGRGQDVVIFILEQLPEEVSRVLAKPITDVISGAPKDVLTMSALVALWTASSGLDAARMAVRRAFHWSGVRPAITRRIESTVLAAIAPLIILPIMALQVAGPSLWAFTGTYITPYVPQFDLLKGSFTTLRLLIAPVLLFLMLLLTFFLFSPRRIRPVAILPGAVTTALFWLLTANGLSLYLRNLANYEATYGSLAGTMVTLLFFFLLGLGFVFGAEVNAAVTERRFGATAIPEEDEPGAPGIFGWMMMQLRRTD